MTAAANKRYLHKLVIDQAQQRPDALAVRGPDRDITYGELDQLANQFAHALLELEVQPDDRVGIWLGKSTIAVAAMQGILRIGAIYVPLDPLSPASRISSIVENCKMRVLITTQQYIEQLSDEHHSITEVTCLLTDAPLLTLQKQMLSDFSIEPVADPMRTEDDIAYILYTSGSTGIPKGVCISHCNALAFVNWATETLQAGPQDHFANHAPFHFDLSVLDLYGAFSVGAAVSLIPEDIAYMPAALVDFLLQERITIWYSVPSVLILMMDQGGLLELTLSDIRCILFAGEPFPTKHLRRLYEHWPSARYLNLYGPTETNVCTYYEIPSFFQDWDKPIPIGKACSGDRVWIKKADTQQDDVGELMVEGPTVMVGYWDQPRHGTVSYATGDIVRLQEDGNYLYVSRRDHMVKVRGHRIELGDIETALMKHQAIHEAAVFVAGTGIEARIVAFIVCTENQSAPSLLELKRYCAEHLPRYMIIDDVQLLSMLPRTRNGKIDRLALSTMN
jgi:amino acid adenylation domain-containing protein